MCQRGKAPSVPARSSKGCIYIVRMHAPMYDKRWWDAYALKMKGRSTPSFCTGIVFVRSGDGWMLLWLSMACWFYSTYPHGWPGSFPPLAQCGREDYQSGDTEQCRQPHKVFQQHLNSVCLNGVATSFKYLQKCFFHTHIVQGGAPGHPCTRRLE